MNDYPCDAEQECKDAQGSRALMLVTEAEATKTSLARNISSWRKVWREIAWPLPITHVNPLNDELLSSLIACDASFIG